jgi:RNA polymerase sigma-70 factor (ECF subfamily)
MRASDSIPFPAAGAPDRLADGAVTTRPATERMDEPAFQTFYRDTAPTLRSYLRRASGNAALADDILQETFYRFLRADLPALEPFQMKAYLYRTATSLLADHWRRLKRERRWNEENSFGSEAAEELDSAGEAMAVFRDLKPREQNLLWLAYVEGFDHREVAAALQLSERSVRVLLFRARRKLAGILKKRGLGPEEGR